MTQKPKFSLEQFNAKHVIPTKAQPRIAGGTIVIGPVSICGKGEGDKEVDKEVDDANA